MAAKHVVQDIIRFISEAHANRLQYRELCELGVERV